MSWLLHQDKLLAQNSYYETSLQRPNPLPVLNGLVQADVVVVGAGFAGLSAAIELAQLGMKVVVLEANRVCSGASGRNGGQLLVGVACGQQLLEKQLGKADAQRVWAMSVEAVNQVAKHMQAWQIDCDYRRGALTVATTHSKVRSLFAEAEYLDKHYGFTVKQISGDLLHHYIQSPHYCAALYDGISAHLHPLKWGLGLVRVALQLGVQIFEQSVVLQLESGKSVSVVTEQGKVQAPFAVLTGNCMLSPYAPTLAKRIASRIMPVGTYMVATEPFDPERCQHWIPSGAAVCDNNLVMDYFRFSADHRLLFGGQVSYSSRTPARLRQRMLARIKRIFPDMKAESVPYLWGGFVDITMNRAPDFGRLTNNIYYLQGFSGHGVALTHLSGQLVAQAIYGQASRFDVFAQLQHTSFPGGVMLRTPTLVLGMLYHRIRDLL